MFSIMVLDIFKGRQYEMPNKRAAESEQSSTQHATTVFFEDALVIFSTHSWMKPCNACVCGPNLGWNSSMHG